MLCMETIGKLRRRHLVKGESISAIARVWGVSSLHFGDHNPLTFCQSVQEIKLSLNTCAIKMLQLSAQSFVQSMGLSIAHIFTSLRN